MPLLEAAGHSVEAIDLPGARGELRGSEVSFDSYVAATVAAAERPGEPVILVGHSLGGRSISAAAEARPELVRALVYVAAMLPSPDRSEPRPATQDNIIAKGFYPVDSGASLMLDEGPARAGFYSDCSADDAQAAFARLVPQPLEAITGPVRLSYARWGSVPRYYVFTLEDRTIPIAFQRDMERSAPCVRTFELPCGHSPFYTHPRELAGMLCAIAREAREGEETGAGR